MKYNRYWRDYNEYELQCQAFEDEKESANRSYEASLQELELLHRTNVFNDTFHISYDGPFGMINGLRLGRLPSQQVYLTICKYKTLANILLLLLD